MRRLTLYRKDGACSIAAHMLLLELDIPFTSIAMKEGPNRHYESADGTGLSREEFLKISPMGYVPALTIDDGGKTTITELSAVLFYISSQAPERGLTGRDDIEKAKVMQWMSWLSTTLNEYGFAGHWRPSRMVGFQAFAEAEEAVKAEGKNTILKGFRILEGWLDESGHAVGGHLTVVDFMLHTFWRWGKAAKFDMDRYPRFREVARRVEETPSAQEALKVERIDMQFIKDEP